MTLTYGDFGRKEASALQSDALEILAEEAGLVLENTLYQKQLNKTSQQTTALTPYAKKLI